LNNADAISPNGILMDLLFDDDFEVVEWWLLSRSGMMEERGDDIRSITR
jgi:hypothetical protein